ncbi:tetratricopeptide repeat protein [Nonomuraea sp. NPDC052129]|uniref:tetratricopeptide repeat protein n=1 Tax=Nonomuraea sp. NPDC052129 TaxID=3154651 RepID=UPI00341445B5
MDTVPTFGEEIRRRRVEAGMSLAGLAKLTFYSAGHLSKIENGLVFPPMRQAWGIDSVLRAGGAVAALLPDKRRQAGGPEHPSGRRLVSGLPHDSIHFRGREAELDEVIAGLCGRGAAPFSPVVVVVHGMAGIGKTALAVRVAHKVAGRFPQGRLMVDLHGHTATTAPLTAAEVLDRLLRRLGVTGAEIPAHLDERAALFRELLIGKDILVVLDNAHDAGQVRSLLPPTSDARFLITSRQSLSSLDDAHHLELGGLSEREAAAVFSSVVLAEVADEAARSAIVTACGGLPLAVRIVAARCKEDPRRVARLAALLGDEWNRLPEMDDGERSIAAAFGMSLRQLPADTRRVFTLLGVHPGTDWTGHAAAALANLDLPDVERHLSVLRRAHLLLTPQQGRYRFHDLVGAYARRTAKDSLTGRERADAIERLAEWFLDTLIRADEIVTPHRHRIKLQMRIAESLLVDLGDYQSAFSWLTAEQHNLVALCRAVDEYRFDTLVWQLAYAMRGYYFLSKRWDDWITTHGYALEAAMRQGDALAEANTRNNLGLALMERGESERSEPHFQRALDLFRQVGDEHGATNATANHAWVLFHRGDYGGALNAGERAFESYHRRGELRNEAIALRSIALAKIELSRYAEAVEHLREALRILAELRLPLDVAMALNCLGEAHHRAGELDDAERELRKAIEWSRACGSTFEEARGYRTLGQVAADRKNPREAERLWNLALSRFRPLGAPDALPVERALQSSGPPPVGAPPERDQR